MRLLESCFFFELFDPFLELTEKENCTCFALFSMGDIKEGNERWEDKMKCNEVSGYEIYRALLDGKFVRERFTQFVYMYLKINV